MSNSAIMMEDTVVPFGDDDNHLSSKKNTVAIFFHIVFKALAILAYVVFGFFTSGFIVTFVIVVVLLALDFWTTKNITGRILVGLRWWNYVDEGGSSHWVFESRKGAVKVTINNYDSSTFWIALFTSEILWVLFVLAALLTFKLQWLMVACVGLCLTGANLYGYIRCKMGSKSKIKTAASNFLGKQVISSMFTRFSSTQQPNNEDPK